MGPVSLAETDNRAAPGVGEYSIYAVATVSAGNFYDPVVSPNDMSVADAHAMSLVQCLTWSAVATVMALTTPVATITSTATSAPMSAAMTTTANGD